MSWFEYCLLSIIEYIEREAPEWLLRRLNRSYEIALTLWECGRGRLSWTSTKRILSGKARLRYTSSYDYWDEEGPF